MILDQHGHPLNGATTKVPGIDPGTRRAMGALFDIDEMEESIEGVANDAMPRVAFSRDRKDYISDKVSMTFAASGQQAGTADTATLHDQQLKYEQSLFVYACVYAIASNLAHVPLTAYVNTPDGPEDQPESPLQELLDRPHEVMNQEEFIEQKTMFLLLAGSSFTYLERGHGEDTMDPRGEILEMKPLRPSRMDIMPGEGHGGVERFEHTVSGRVSKIHPLNMAWTRRSNPNNDYWGLSPLTLIERTMQIDEGVEIYNHTALDTGGVPDVILEAPHAMGRGKAGRARRQWNQHYRTGRSGGAIVLDEGLSARAFGVSPKDMQFHQMSEITMHRILAAFGVPPIMVMDLRDASVLANAKEQRELFWENTVMPLGRKEASSITRAIHTDPRFPREGGWGVRFAFEKADFQRKDDAQIAQAARDNYSAGLITLNEARQDLGKEPREDGDELKQSGGGFGFESLSFADAEPKARVLPHASEEFKALARTSHRRLVAAWEGSFLEGYKSFFGEQMNRVISRLNAHTNKSSKSRHRTDDFADEDFLAALFPGVEENQELSEKIGNIFLGAALDAGNQKIEQLFPSGIIEALSEENDRMKSLLLTWEKKSELINRETQQGIRDILVEAFQLGSTDDTVARNIKNLFKRYRIGTEKSRTTRAEAIARTESQMALNSGSFEAARDAEASGVKLFKSWLSSRDDRVRPSHSDLDSFTSKSPLPLGQPFPNGLMHPHDPAGPAGEVINCRCSLIEIVPERPR